MDLMQDPVVNVRLKVLPATASCPLANGHPYRQVCTMARDVCIIARHGSVAEAGEELRLDRVKSILAR